MCENDGEELRVRRSGHTLLPADMLNRDEGGMGCANFAVESNLARVVVHETQSDDGG